MGREGVVSPGKSYLKASDVGKRHASGPCLCLQSPLAVRVCTWGDEHPLQSPPPALSHRHQLSAHIWSRFQQRDPIPTYAHREHQEQARM